MIVFALGFLFGVTVGMAHFLLLSANARLYTAGGSWRKAGLLHASRLALTAALLWLVAQAGAIALIAALAGFLVARSILLVRLAFGHG